MQKSYKPLDLLFAGREDCLGNYILEGSPEPGKKFEGRAISYPNSKYPDRQLTPADYDAHFKGKVALGVVPVYLDGTCKWFAIDIDDYHLDHLALARKLSKLQIPLVHCRSKSGGAHLYGLCVEPIKATDAISLARKWCVELGFNPMKTEIFPKQTKFDDKDAKGNWIIIPYFGGDRAIDFAIDENGKKVEFEDFLAYCQARVFTVSEAKGYLKAKVEKQWSRDEIIEQSPPCISAMMENRLKEGDGRNNASSHLSWYYRQLDEFFETNDWRDKLAEFNQEYFDPPMNFQELNQVIKNHSGAKSYKARCTVNPMAVFCDKQECLKRKFGIKPDGTEYHEFQFTALTKIDLGDNPLWRPYVNGQAITVDTQTFMNSRLFRQAALARLNIIIPLLKQPDWDALLIPLLKDALVIEEANIVSNYGKTESCFKQWISQVIEKSKDISKLLDGLPYFDKDRIYFRHQDFVLEYRRVFKENVDDKEIFVVLKSLGFTAKKMVIGDKKLDVMEYKVEKEEIWFNVPEERKF